MNKLEDSVINYQISFERYKNGKANEIIELLDKSDKEISKFIKETDGVYTKARYKEIASKLKDVSKTLKENVDKNIDIDGVIDYELRKEKKLLDLAKPYIKNIKGGQVNFLYPTREQIKTSALFTPITTDGYGMTYQSYLDGIETGLFNTWDSAVRTGYLTGQTSKEITRNVLGSSSKVGQLVEQGTIYSLRNNIYSNTKTALQAFANETMHRVYSENEKYFGDGESDYKYEYLSTLDSRTCLVCGEADGKLYKTLNDCPHIPQHRGCRCMIIPYFNIEGDTRASKTGQVDNNLTFENWLKEQDEATQKDVLGASRYRMYKIGEIEGKNIQFTDNGKVKTLEQLNEEFDNVANSKSQQPVSGKNFSAEKWSEYYKDPKSKDLDYLLSKMDNSEELTKRCIETEKLNEALEQTYKKYRIEGKGADAVYTKVRALFHEKKINEFLLKNSNAIVGENETPKLIMLGGRGGSGKSTFEGLVYNSSRFCKIDSDDIKGWFKELGYQEWNASQFHVESTDVMKKVIEKASKLRMNIVIDGTMSGLESNFKLLQAFKEIGYYTEADYMFLPPQESFVRAMLRFENGGKYDGRFVPMKVLMNMTENEKVFDVLKDYCDNWRFYSNYGIKKGDLPILISSKYT